MRDTHTYYNISSVSIIFDREIYSPSFETNNEKLLPIISSTDPCFHPLTLHAAFSPRLRLTFRRHFHIQNS